ncbi:MAG: DUF4231 domain-containing protein [Prochlorococcaceae cyanobacterium]
MDANAYIEERVDRQLRWLSDNSKKNKQNYMRYRVCGIALGALVTVLAPYAGREGPYSKWLVPALLQVSGAGVTVLGSLLALNRHQENWLRYRLLKETLEREKLLYLTGSLEAYSGPEAFHEFVRRSESIMAEERIGWVNQAADRAQAGDKQAKLESDSASPAADSDNSSTHPMP